MLSLRVNINIWKGHFQLKYILHPEYSAQRGITTYQGGVARLTIQVWYRVLLFFKHELIPAETRWLPYIFLNQICTK